MSRGFLRWREWFRGKRGGNATPRLPGARALHELPREQLRAAASMALGPGISRRLTTLGQSPCRAVDRLEAWLAESSGPGRRFGSMLRELSNPDLLILALIVRDGGLEASSGVRLASAGAVAEHLQLGKDSRHFLEFLVLDDLRMSGLASGAPDAVAVESFAGYLNKASTFSAFTAEEHLKALFLMTLATLDAEGALSAERARQLARLYDDTYSQLTKAYGDQMIDTALAKRSAVNIARPAGMTEHELLEFLTGFPRRYLTLFDSRTISEHVRMCRQLTADGVQCALTKAGGGVWELTVATHDRPYLFSSICGVLAHLNADIVSGQAMTSAQGVALGIFRFHDDEGALERSDPKPILIDAIAGRVDVEPLVMHMQHTAKGASPDERMVSIDNDASTRYTVVEMIAGNAPGLLYRVSRALSDCGCSLEMVVIATEGPRAHDVFHITKDGQKLGPEDQRAVSAALERVTSGFMRSGS